MADRPSSAKTSTSATPSDLAFCADTRWDDLLRAYFTPPVAAFSGTPTTGALPLVVTFTDESTGEPTSWCWDFGDGHTSAEQSPAHTYTDAGTCTVSLTVTNEAGSDTATKPGYVFVTFADVPVGEEEQWALHEIIACVNAGIVQGYADGSYRPDLAVTRGQMAVYVARALAGGDAHVPTPPAESTFSDVPATGYGDDGTEAHWAYPYVEYCAAEDIVQGYWDGTYRPDEVVNRGAMAVYVARAAATPTGDAGVPGLPEDFAPTFADVPGEDTAWEWCWKYVEYCAASGIVQGYWDGTYHPEREVTRDQMAVYVQRAFGLPM